MLMMQQKQKLKWIDKNFGEDQLKLISLKKIQIEFQEQLKIEKKLLKKKMKMM
jgi:hypothetical protein